MIYEKKFTKQSLVHLLTFLFISVLLFGCNSSANNETEMIKENSPENASFFEPKTEGEFEGDVNERQNWFINQRKYPFDKLPEDARKNAWISRPADASQGDGQEVASWETVGPSPTTSGFPSNWGVTSGRINTIAVSPTNSELVLIGAATGGIWRSTNGGTTFSPVSDNHVDLAVGSIAFAPNNPSIVYAGMGDKAGNDYLGTGILKSTNGGQTWTQINNTTFFSHGRVTKILVDPSNANRVYVAQNNFRQGNQTNFAGGMWVSSDGGVNWQRTLTGTAQDVVFHPTQPNTLYAGLTVVNNGSQFVTGGVFKSTNNGQTWSQIYTSPTNTINIRVAVSAAAPQWVYVVSGFFNNNQPDAKLEISTNEGSTWNLRNNTFDKGQIHYNLYLYAFPNNQNQIAVGTRDVFGSNDAGTSYFNLTKNFDANGTYNPPQFGANTHPDQHNMYISPTNPNIIYVANDGGLSRSTDTAATFQSLNASLSLTMFTSIALHPTNPAISYGGTQDNGTQRRTGNTSWQEFSGGDGGQIVIDALDPSIVFSTYIEHSITRHTNNGVGNGQVVGSENAFGNDRVAFYPPLDGNRVNSNLYFGTFRLWISTDRGNTWTAPGGATDLTNGKTLSAIGVGKSDVNTIYTGSEDGRLSVSTNGGTTWTNRSAGLPNRFIKSIAVNPTNSNIAYVTVSGYDSGHVFKTTNAGASWTDISGNLANIPTNTLLIDVNTPTTLYVGTDVGVYRSITDGNTWETFNTGMPPVVVSELDMQAGGLMQAATYGRGAYKMNVVAPPVNNVRPPFDFDGDSKSDISVFRPSNGAWYLNQSTAGFTGVVFGQNGDLTTPADFDGDGKADVAVFRPSNGAWYYLKSSNNAFVGLLFGQNGDLPRPADFDGDGKADINVFRPSNGAWYRLNSTDGSFFGTLFGQNGDQPLVANFDGDNKSDIAVFRPSAGAFYWLESTTGGFKAIGFGFGTDIPTMGDFDGDNKTDIAVFRPSNGAWYRFNSSNSAFFGVGFGQNGDIPVTGDYDGDGKSDIAVFRPSNGAWYYLKSSNGGFVGLGFGFGTDKPIPSAFQ